MLNRFLITIIFFMLQMSQETVWQRGIVNSREVVSVSVRIVLSRADQERGRLTMTHVSCPFFFF